MLSWNLICFMYRYAWLFNYNTAYIRTIIVLIFKLVILSIKYKTMTSSLRERQSEVESRVIESRFDDWMLIEDVSESKENTTVIETFEIINNVSDEYDVKKES